MIIDAFLPPIELDSPIIVKEKKKEMNQRGIIHSKVSGKFEIVQELPKNADTLENIFNYADAFGQIRFAYINNVAKIAPSPTKIEKSASAIGGEFGINTATYYGFGFHISAYLSQNIHFLNPSKENLNNDFVNTDNNSFVYIAEASIDYSNDFFQTKLGRIKVETPYADSDDIRMAANTFEGTWMNIDYTSALTTQIMFLKRWAGYDSQDVTVDKSQDKFKDLVSDNAFGMLIGSLTYEYSEKSEISFWYSYIDKMSAISYAEIIGIYFIDGRSFHVDYGIQASNISELDNSGVAGDIIGAMSILHYRGLFLGASYNKAFVNDGRYIVDGFGGGPYYTSLDEASISVISEASVGKDVESFRIGTGYNLKKTGINQLQGYMLELVYGELYTKDEKIKEKDIILTYKESKKINIEGIYTQFDSSYNSNTFNRTLLRINYLF